MQKIENDEMKGILLDLLSNVDAYCKKHDIQYFLDSGTLLGAVRHKGFIPWDDDVDICMTRPNYDKFLQSVKRDKIADNIDIYMPEETLFAYVKVYDNRTILIEYPNTFRLQLAVYIDIFPKDGLPDSLTISKLHCKLSDFFGNLYWFNKYSIPTWKKSGNIGKKIVAHLASPFLYNRTFPLYLSNKIAKKYDYNSSNYTSSILAGGIRGRVPVKCFSSSVEATFEGRKFPIPVGYDQYLRKLYENINNGDYMILPDVKDRTKHDTEVYWK